MLEMELYILPTSELVGDGGLNEKISEMRTLERKRFYAERINRKIDEQVISVTKCIIRWVHCITLRIIHNARDKLTKSQP